MKNSILFRKLCAADCKKISATINDQGWIKPVSQYEKYLEELAYCTRDTNIAVIDGTFAGYLTIKWESDYIPFREMRIPEIVDLNVLRKYQRMKIATTLMGRGQTKY